MTTTRTPFNKCANCGYAIDAAASTPDHPDATPRPGDVSLCLRCAHIHIFANDLTVREPTDEEVVEIAGDPELVRAVNAIGWLNASRT